MVGRSIVGEEGWNIVEYTLIRLPWHHRIPNRWRRNAERSQVWPNMYRIWTEGNERDRIKIHHNEGRTVDGEKKKRALAGKSNVAGLSDWMVHLQMRSWWAQWKQIESNSILIENEASRMSDKTPRKKKKSQGKSKGPPGKGSISTWMLELKKKREWAQTGRYDPWSVSASNLIRVSIHLGKGDDFQMFASLAR